MEDVSKLRTIAVKSKRGDGSLMPEDITDEQDVNDEEEPYLQRLSFSISSVKPISLTSSHSCLFFVDSNHCLYMVNQLQKSANSFKATPVLLRQLLGHSCSVSGKAKDCQKCNLEVQEERRASEDVVAVIAAHQGQVTCMRINTRLQVCDASQRIASIASQHITSIQATSSGDLIVPLHTR